MITKFLFLLVSFSLQDQDYSKMGDPTEGFSFSRSSNIEKATWEKQRLDIANELSQRLEGRVKDYNNTMNARAEHMERLSAQAKELSQLEKNYVPYEKGSGNNAYRSQELRTQMQSTMQSIDKLTVEAEQSFQRMAKSATKLERFSNRSNLSKTTSGQMEMLKSSLGKNMMVYANNPTLPHMIETIKGTSIGKGTNTLPNGLTEEGVIKASNDRSIRYKAGEAIHVRNVDGGILRGVVAGATPSGELVIKETSLAGMHPLKQGTYRVVNPAEVSTISMISASTHFKDPLNQTEKFKNVGGRIYEFRPTETARLERIKELVNKPPALNASNPNTNLATPVRTIGGAR